VSDLTEQEPPLLETVFHDIDVAFVTVPTASHYHVAQAAARHSTHLFLEWPPATSIRECESIVQLAEEAGVEAGLSRPLRFHPLFDVLTDDQRVHLIVLRQEVDASTPAVWPPRCADTLDLCCALARSHSIQRIDAEAVPRHAAWPEAIAFALRFHSGTYAQVSLYRRQQPGADLLYVAGADFQFESDFDGSALHGRPSPEDATITEDTQAPVAQETEAFLDAIAAGQIPPVTVLDGLHTMRLVERLMEQLR
jgi:predicted dehydrogenase